MKRNDPASKLFLDPAMRQLAELVPALSSFLVAIDDQGLPENDILRAIVEKELPDLYANEAIATFLERKKTSRLEIVKTIMHNISITPGCLTIHGSAELIPEGEEFIEEEQLAANGVLVKGCASKQLAKLYFILLFDTLNKEVVPIVQSMTFLSRDEGDNSGISLLPSGRIDFYQGTPTKVTLQRKYGKLPKGTKLTLDFDRLIYEDADHKYGDGIPVDIVNVLLNSALSDQKLESYFIAQDFVPRTDAAAAQPQDFDEDEDDERASFGLFQAMVQGGGLDEDDEDDDDEDFGSSIIDTILKDRDNDVDDDEDEDYFDKEKED
jgi:hypothetical protein